MAIQRPDFKLIFKRMLPKCLCPRGSAPGPSGGFTAPPDPQLKRLGHTPRWTTLLKNLSRATAGDHMGSRILILVRPTNALYAHLKKWEMLVSFTVMFLCLSLHIFPFLSFKLGVLFGMCLQVYRHNADLPTATILA